MKIILKMDWKSGADCSLLVWRRLYTNGNTWFSCLVLIQSAVMTVQMRPEMIHFKCNAFLANILPHS